MFLSSINYTNLFGLNLKTIKINHKRVVVFGGCIANLQIQNEHRQHVTVTQNSNLFQPLKQLITKGTKMN